ncbi:MAG: phospho-sugar mutase [Bacillaceae bacterium]|nr:phospho-sugar mutase [Bacillaceae bacterium]
MSWKQAYKRWKQFDKLDQELKQQLDRMDDRDLEDAFYKPLTFGTGGMRGELGPGTNRMNIYTIRKATEGLARYLEEKGEEWAAKGIVVAHDSRHMSPDFALETAKVMGAHGIPTTLFTSLRPTPELSFAVRHLGAAAGVVITASHNPPEYNGFKVYNEDGGQVPPEEAEKIIAKVNEVENELTVEVAEKEDMEANGLLRWVDEEVDAAYLDQLHTIVRNPEVIKEQAENLKIVFTPLHGTSRDLIVRGLNQLEFKHVTVVEEQAEPDPEFSTVESPNPEEHQAFTMAIEYGERLDADILIGTDPDADRLGVAVKNDQGEYQVLTGNQLGALMLHYLLSQADELPDNGVMLKTIVTSEMGWAIADHFGVKTVDTLTGFKFIGEKIRQYEETDEHTFLFGYEESYGYLIDDFVRDKDAIQAAMVACEMTAFYKSKGKTLLQALEDLYQHIGYYLEDLHSITLKGKEGEEQIRNIMEDFRKNPLDGAGDFNVYAVEDYQSSERTFVEDGRKETIHLPKSNVVKFLFQHDCWCCLRPSGTEPKIKFYFGVRGKNREESENRLKTLKEIVLCRIHELV